METFEEKEQKLYECEACWRLILPSDYLGYGCPNCESRHIRKYNGIIGQYTRETQSD